MKTLSKIFLLCSFVSSPMAFSQVELNKRCEEDNLEPDQALGRFQWLKRCHKEVLTGFHDTLFPEYRDDSAESKLQVLENEWLYTRGRLRGRPQYLTFGLADYSNPLNWKAPTDSKTSCGIPRGYVAIATCTSSCYHPSQQVLFEVGEVPIKEAFDQKLARIFTLSDESSLDEMDLRLRQVQSYTESLTETHHELVQLTMASGGELKVTPNHPLLKSNGVLVEAQELKVNDHLLTQFGTHDRIVETTVETFFGKVYNVSPQARTLQGHILIAQGYLSGSSWYQNQGVEQLNRVILRSNVPANLFESK